MLKRCPECYEVFDQEENFCENDGQLLLLDPTLSVVSDEEVASASPQPGRDAWVIGLVGLLVGVLISAVGYVAISVWSFDSAPEDPDPPAYALQSQPSQSRRAQTDNDPTSQPSETSEQPDAETEPATGDDALVQGQPAADNSPDSSHLNKGPVTTGEKSKTNGDEAVARNIIYMNDGSTLEVDAAWNDKAGVWYRRGGLVSFVESSRVKRIITVAEPSLP